MIRTRLQGDTPFFPNMLNNGKVEVRLKEDVDKVIADLEESHKKEVEQLLMEIVKLNESAQNLILDNYLKDKKLRHSNYKRCLAMAKLCGLMSAFHNGEWYTRWINRWYNRWLELAEKFKEVI